ncbi:hypothetical protein [Rhizobium binae]|uniref:hypothetical protein n=1 Tax=Rhizobium binae TaxID=1138190 RepID=UPI001C8397A6|nr:hypothetical protein [Rhizobium binae]MBX4941203.1 hypothetical protein [Rhizobium binae]
MDIDAHAQRAAEMRRAAEYADGIATNLRKLNAGPVFDHERERLINEVNCWFAAVSTILGKETA